MIYGYVRTSKKSQTTDPQISVLENFGVDKIYEDKLSGSSMNRPKLQELLSVVLPGDTIVVYKLDRLGRNIKGLILFLEQLNKKNVSFFSISEPIIDTRNENPYTKLVTQIMMVFAEFELNQTRERIMNGLEYARKSGKILGRPAGVSTKIKNSFDKAYALYENEPNLSIDEILEDFKLSKATFYKLIELYDKKLRSDIIYEYE